MCRSGITDEHVDARRALARLGARPRQRRRGARRRGPGAEVLAGLGGSVAGLGSWPSRCPSASAAAAGRLLDLAVALEAGGDGLVPGPLLSTATAGAGRARGATAVARATRHGCDRGSPLALRAGCGPAGPAARRHRRGRRTPPPPIACWSRCEHLADGCALEAGQVEPDRRGHGSRPAPTAGTAPRRVASARSTRARARSTVRLRTSWRRSLTILGAAEAAGIARWCVDTAVAYAKVREQFGRKIGSFQAVKHLCARDARGQRVRHRGRLGRRVGARRRRRPARVRRGRGRQPWRPTPR